MEIKKSLSEIVWMCLNHLLQKLFQKIRKNNTCELICIDEFIAGLFDEEETEANIVSWAKGIGA